tara:strand:- start:2231 stop:3148 length:918 start_codon:yes stop_codon:yes gene_type:complete
MIKLNIFIIIISMVYCQPIGAFQGGFATENIDANSIGYGAIGILNNENSFGPLYNPGLINENFFSIGFSYNHLTLDRYSNSIIVGFRVPPKARASIGYIGSGVKDIIGRGYTGQITDSFKWTNHHLFFTFGFQLFTKLSAGIKLNIFFQNLIEEVSSTGLGFDIGCLLKPVQKIDLGITIRNIKAKSNWKIKLDDGTMRDYNEFYPLIISFGSNIKLIPNLSILNQFDFYNFDEIGYIGNEKKIGINYKINKFNSPINLRTGINDKNFTFGFSLPVKKYAGMNYGIFISRINMGNSHVFTWDIAL